MVLFLEVYLAAHVQQWLGICIKCIQHPGKEQQGTT
jgi:hypothetical protein